MANLMRMLRVLGAGLLLVVGLAACAGRWGAIRYDSGVGQLFETAQVLPGHRYFIAGSEAEPDAILALREDRPLRSDLWHEVAMTPEILARLVDRMRGTRDGGPHGSIVLDDRREPIGAWWSFQRSPPVKLLDDGGVVVTPPVGDSSQTPWPSGPESD